MASRNNEGADDSVRVSAPSGSKQRGKADAFRDTKPAELAQYETARANLDETLMLLEWALDVRLALRCGIDLDDAAGSVEQLKRDVAAHVFVRRASA